MTIKDVRGLIAKAEVNKDVLNRINLELDKYGDETVISDEALDLIIELLQLDIDTDKLELEMIDEAIMKLSGFLGEIKQGYKIIEDTAEAATKNMYKEVEEEMKKVSGEE